MSDPIRIGVNGAAGRMGQRIVALTLQDDELQLAAAYETENSPLLGQDAGEVARAGAAGVKIARQERRDVDVIIDFSTPDGLMKVVEFCTDRNIALVVATTGLNAQQKKAVETASHLIPLLIAPSMSVAVNLAMKLVGDAGKILKGVNDDVDVEIIERHHRFKEDAPSGTALHFGKIVAGAMGQSSHVHGREGRPGARPRNEIGYHALRTGDNVGEHTIVFGMMGETLEVTVRGHTRDSYAYGALAAAKYLYGKEAGLYSMSDVLGF